MKSDLHICLTSIPNPTCKRRSKPLFRASRLSHSYGRRGHTMQHTTSRRLQPFCSDAAHLQPRPFKPERPQSLPWHTCFEDNTSCIGYMVPFRCMWQGVYPIGPVAERLFPKNIHTQTVQITSIMYTYSGSELGSNCYARIVLGTSPFPLVYRLFQDQGTSYSTTRYILRLK